MRTYSEEIRKVGIVTIIWNVLLSIFKVVAGILSHASSLISDGIHSVSDVFTTIIVLIGAKLSSKSPDKEHPFGHERMESIASILLAMLLGATSFILGYSGVKSIIEYSKGIMPSSNGFIYLALGSSLSSIIVKFIMYVYTIRVAKRINSTSLKADAYHHLSDSLSSFGSVLGIVGLMLGGCWSILDPIASIVIALFILKVAYDVAKSAINEVVDHAAPEEFENSIKEIVNNTDGVVSINSLKTRQFGNKYYVEIEIAVEGSISVKEGHSIAKKVHDQIEDKYEDIKHCMIHVDPYE